MRHSEAERSLAQRKLCTNTSALSSHRWRIAFSSIFILALVLIGLLAARGITTEPAEKDAVENLANAFNLAFHGVYSSGEDPPNLIPPCAGSHSRTSCSRPGCQFSLCPVSKISPA